MARQEKFKHKKVFSVLWPPLPALCIVYVHHASTKPPLLAGIPAQP